MKVPPVNLVKLTNESESTLDVVEPPRGKRCRCRGCGRPATAVAVSTSEMSSYPVAYCERHGRVVERLGRHVTYFPFCAIETCGEIASTLALIQTSPARSEWLLVCGVHCG